MILGLILLGLVRSSDNWAVVIDSSRFYFNYRHTVNSLLIYQTLKKFGFPDDHIILMLPENHQCHPRNPYPGKIFDGFHSDDLMSDVEIDYRGTEVTPESIINLLISRHSPHLPIGKRLNSNANSKVFIYLTGHGGNGYFKIQDTLVLTSADLAYAVNEMNEKKRFGELLVILDTCQAESMFDFIDIPGVHTMTSSLTGEPAKSYGSHAELGISTTDHFTYFFSEIFRGKNSTSIEKITLEHVKQKLPKSMIKSRIWYKSRTKAEYVLIKNFITYTEGNGKIREINVDIEESTGKLWNQRKSDEKVQENLIGKTNGDWAFTSVFVFAIGTLAFYLGNLI